jgi:hypothetical protein
MLRDGLDQLVVELPSLHLLRAALLAGRALTASDGTPLSALPVSWARTPSEGVVSPGELAAGFELLREVGLIVILARRVLPTVDLTALLAVSEDEACRALAGRLIAIRRPVWINAVTAGGIVATEMLPDQAAAALGQLFPDPTDREQFLLAIGRRFEDDDAKRIGDLAEVAVTEACRRELRTAGRDDLAKQVRRVSLTSDQLGYDITAPRLDRSARHLEIKGTRNANPDLLIMISRNEVAVASHDPNWFLVVCIVYPDDRATVVGWTTQTLLTPRLPIDRAGRGGWRVAAVPLAQEELVPGLPPCYIPT